MKHSVFNETDVYNRLPDVIDADAKLKAMGKYQILMPLCETILKYGLEDTVGIRLLHNHNAIGQHEIMVEQEELDRNGSYCLSTVAADKVTYMPKAYANSWQLFKDAQVPLEYSLDPYVVSESDTIITKKEFLAEFQQNLEQLNVSGLLGLCILKRRFYEERIPAGVEELQLVETTDGKRRANILRFYRGQFNVDQLIETVWLAERTEAELESLTTCRKRQVCTPTCYPNPVVHCDPTDDGGHVQTNTVEHNRVHERTDHEPDPGEKEG